MRDAGALSGTIVLNSLEGETAPDSLQDRSWNKDTQTSLIKKKKMQCLNTMDNDQCCHHHHCSSSSSSTGTSKFIGNPAEGTFQKGSSSKETNSKDSRRLFSSPAEPLNISHLYYNNLRTQNGSSDRTVGPLVLPAGNLGQGSSDFPRATAIMKLLRRHRRKVTVLVVGAACFLLGVALPLLIRHWTQQDQVGRTSNKSSKLSYIGHPRVIIDKFPNQSRQHHLPVDQEEMEKARSEQSVTAGGSGGEVRERWNSTSSADYKLDGVLKDLFISVKTTRRFHHPRLVIILETWASLVKSQVMAVIMACFGI